MLLGQVLIWLIFFIVLPIFMHVIFVQYAITSLYNAVRRCRRVCPCPSVRRPASPSDRYTDYGYCVNSHLRRVKKKCLYTKRTGEALSPPAAARDISISPGDPFSPLSILLSVCPCDHVLRPFICTRVCAYK